ncbi:MAG: PIN domain-containing protein [Verrucomicrobiota bacterium]
MKFVLDSDVFIEAARPKGNPAVHRWLFALPPLARLVCPVTLAEFLAGQDFVSRQQRMRERRLAASSLKWEWNGFDEDVAAVWAGLQRAGRRNGFSMDDNDCWLAALACRRGARLATRNTAHFQPLVDCGTGLLLVNPWDN